jgi:sec-independent protein translocase protein TatB
MFDIGWSEMMVVGLVALVVIGPKDLPAALRQAGKWMGSVRRMASEFQGHVNAAMREAELDELRREVTNLKSGLTDPLTNTGGEMRALVEKPIALPPPVTVAPKPAAAKTASKKTAAKPRTKAVKPAAKPAPKAKAKTAAKPKKPAGKKT